MSKDTIGNAQEIKVLTILSIKLDKRLFKNAEVEIRLESK